MQSSSQIAPQAQPCRSRPHLARGVKVLVGERALQLAVHLQLEQEQHHLWMEKWRGTGVMQDCTRSAAPPSLEECVEQQQRGCGREGAGKTGSTQYGTAAAAAGCEGRWEVFISAWDHSRQQSSKPTSLLIRSERSVVSASMAGSHCTADSRPRRRLSRWAWRAERPADELRGARTCQPG